MKCHKIIIVGMLLMAVCTPLNVLASDQSSDHNQARQMPPDDSSQASRDLGNLLRDQERSLLLLRDRTRIHNMLKQPALRQEMLQHPRFMRQLVQIREMRQELMENEQMMLEMLMCREIYREISQNREIMEEIENNEMYRHINQEQQANILEELLLEPTKSEADSRRSNR